MHAIHRYLLPPLHQRGPSEPVAFDFSSFLSADAGGSAIRCLPLPERRAGDAANDTESLQAKLAPQHLANEKDSTAGFYIISSSSS